MSARAVRLTVPMRRYLRVMVGADDWTMAELRRELRAGKVRWSAATWFALRERGLVAGNVYFDRWRVTDAGREAVADAG